jgi:hypothetical protein
VVLIVLTVALAVGLLAVFRAPAFDRHTVEALRVAELPLLIACLLVFLHLRRLRWARLGPSGTSEFRSKGDSSAQDVMPWSSDKIAGSYRQRRAWLYRLRYGRSARPTTRRSRTRQPLAPPPVARRTVSSGHAPVALERIEQLLGNTLYELDLTRGHHQLSRAQLVELRVLGLRASAWLNSRTEFVVLSTVGIGAAKDQLNTGVARYAALAKAAEGFLTGRVPLRELTVASQKLANWIE